MMGGTASESAYRVLMGVLESRTGQTLSPNRIWRIEMSLKPVMQRHGIGDLDALVAALVTSNSRQLLDDTVDAMLNNETYFYREHSVFDDIANSALEYIHRINLRERRLTIWHCGVSTGQEAYSMAMLLAEQDSKWAGWRVDIVGTDVSYHAVGRARVGLYSQFEIQRGLPVQMLMRYFRKNDSNWHIADTIRGMAQFREYNLLSDLRPLGRFDIVFCRNVLIYFDQPTKARVLEAIAGLMPPDGLLYLGGAETVLGITSRFAPMPNERGVYGVAGGTAPAAASRMAAVG